VDKLSTCTLSHSLQIPCDQRTSFESDQTTKATTQLSKTEHNPATGLLEGRNRMPQVQATTARLYSTIALIACSAAAGDATYGRPKFHYQEHRYARF